MLWLKILVITGLVCVEYGSEFIKTNQFVVSYINLKFTNLKQNYLMNFYLTAETQRGRTIKLKKQIPKDK
jgi:hypothetical protein